MPVMYDDSSLARNKTARACSIASPNRPIGRWFIRRLSFSGVLRKSIRRGVFKGPLWILF